MKKILIAVDDTRNSRAVLTTFYNLVNMPEEVVLLHVQRLEGKSLLIDMLGDAELSTLKESMKGTDHKEKLDRKALHVLDYFRKEIEESRTTKVKTIYREGIPADEILKAAAEENVELIVLGANTRKGFSRLISGSIADDVEKHAKVPVLLAKQGLMCEEPYRWKDAYAAVSVTTVIILGLFLLNFILQTGKFAN